MAITAHVGDGVPVLRYGPDNNFSKFKEKLSTAAIEKYGDLGRLVETGEYYEPPEPDISDFDLDNDPYGVNAADFKDQKREYRKKMAEMESNKSKLYATMLSKMSTESMDELKRHEDYEDFNREKDPLMLWLAITMIHQVASVSKVASVVKKAARDKYASMRQGQFETIITYKERFDAAVEAYNDMENPEMRDADIAMDFLNGLDDNRYAEFKVEIVNDIAKGAMKQPKTLNDVYLLASRRLVAKKSTGSSIGVSFATADSAITRRHGKDRRKDSHKSGNMQDEHKNKNKDKSARVPSAEPEKKAETSKKNFECYKCGKQGHYARECTASDDDDEPESKVNAYATWAVFATRRQGLRKHEVYLDNCSEVSVLHPRFLTDLRNTQDMGFAGLSGDTTDITTVGYLEDFFDCLACENCSANILSQSDVEEKYEITYVQGEKYIVHLPERDLEFKRRGKLYVADMSDWITTARVHATTAERESLYTKKEVIRAKQAQDFIKASGYTSEKEAAHMVNDGNITGVPITAKDIHRAFDIYGRPAAAVRGKTTRKKVSRAEVDDALKEQRTDQVLYTDVMKVREQAYLVSLVEPLQLVVTSNIDREKTENFGLAIQAQLNLLRSRGFNPVRIHMDPQPALSALVGQFPGVEIDITGAGDHLDKVDAKIRRLKETIRSVSAGLPWKLPSSRVKDLVTYATIRTNARRTTSSTTAVAPRVAFTGRKINYKKEYELEFGTYCECYDPKVISRDAERDRTEPCIALFPAVNANGSWVFLNLKTNRYVRRSNWVKMVTTDLVITRMNASVEEEDGENAGVALIAVQDNADDKGRDTTHVPPATHHVEADVDPPMTATEQEAVENESALEQAQESTAQNGSPEEEVQPQEMVAETPSEPPPDTRRSARVVAGVRKPTRFCYHTSVKKALKEHGKDAYDAIIKEFKQLFKEKKALIPVNRGDLSARQMKQIIRSSMFLKTKFDAKGTFEKIKARLVADGSKQDRALYPDNSSHTVTMQSLLMTLLIAAKEGRKAMKIDIGGAYLNAEMTGEEVIMEVDKMLTRMVQRYLPETEPYVENGKLLVRLDKALYGCIQSAKLWHEKLTGVLKNIGFVPNPVDPCIMNKTVNGKQCTLAIFVDDILALSVDTDTLEWVLAELKKEFDDVKADIGNDLSYLGMHIQLTNGKATVSMTQFLKELLDDYGHVREFNTPATSRLFNAKAAEELDEAEKKKFHTVVAKLLYLSKRTRADILTAVAYLCTRVRYPTKEDKKKLDRVMGYLSATRDRKLILTCEKDIRVIAHIDAAFGTHSDGKSHSGAAFFIGDACVLAMSKKQKIVTKDSTEAELVALSDLITTVEQCDEFMREQGMKNMKIPIILQDNMSTISLVTKGGGKPRTKHLRVRQHLIRDKVSGKEISILHTPTTRMLADTMTKPVQGEQFRWMVGRIMGDNPKPHGPHAMVDRGALSGATDSCERVRLKEKTKSK